ncbi:DUF1600 domain-containing protein [Mycoplasmoides gallisepticum]|uniref:DUF1600 domain-containing protein n=1 Tax=Mycoplasmoides gallisepticum TaxID=2096 RepID=UPI0012442CD3|nr:DUF1600 domain-containing protein [Mycoplasmoides gallisepticum]QEX47480.1 DUF1600 domain-containing protein [Mycoplasmoides gallisepticum]ULH62096.1 DUF1600 domain-containing protein [Mycoplasmoides gallisepticum]ULH67438.1 DUF1600 domain-containing protein [Mycoplasmoides gallisepticum]ULH68164.1 DUF1600 domain-containing protein [Mycoplasmoides gallisepticum]WGG23762.1 DUF1600 domain-containing protein [Mycoplasmoides gallisepticum]
MNQIDKKPKSFSFWFKYELTKAQKIFFFVFWLNLATVIFIVQEVVAELLSNVNSVNNLNNFVDAYKTFDKFTNQSNFILLVFSFFYVFLPRHSFLKKDKFLVASIVYILFTFFGYNIILQFGRLGYRFITNSTKLARGLMIHLFNPVTFIIAGFLAFVYSPARTIGKFHTYLIPGIIYPIIYGIYVISVPYLYKTVDGSVYSVYGGVTNVIENPKIAWVAIIALLFGYFPLSYFIVWISYVKISKKYIDYPASLRKRSIKFIKFEMKP